jgi:hypothetical protein
MSDPFLLVVVDRNAATNRFNAEMDSYEERYGRRPNRHEMASMYAAARKRAGLPD